MGFLFTSQKKKNSNVVIFDIGSGSIGAAIVQLPTNKQELPVIIKSTRTEISASEESNLDLLLKNMLRAIDSVSININKNNPCVISDVFCVLSSPWYISETRIVKMEREYPFNFNQHFANDLIQKEILNLTESYKKVYGEVGAPEVIESLIMGVSLNGYQTTDPIGKTCKTIEMNILASLSPVYFLNKIRENISKYFHHIPINFSSFAASTYIAVRDRYIGADSYILMDISGEITDISVITNGILRYSMSFPQGKKTFLRYISDTKKIELRDANELFNLFNAGHLSSQIKIKTNQLFKTIESMWSSEFRKCLDGLPNTIILPDIVFVTADNDIKQWFIDIIQNEDYINSRLGRKFKVINLDAPQFFEMCSVKNSICDPFLMIEAISVMRKKEK